MKCFNCNSTNVQKDGNHNGYQRYKCLNCHKTFDYGKYENINEYILHFNLKIKKQDNNKLTRENYCIPSNRPSYSGRCVYNDEWVKNQYEKCLKIFDDNMTKFSKLNHNDFNNYLINFVNKYDFKEIKDLSEVNNISGIYIMVLDNYSQVYIGMSKNTIKRRIIEHWRKKVPFDRLVSIKNHLISIDSFGALDTTRIFYKKVESKFCENYIDKIVNEFNDNYKLNCNADKKSPIL